MDKTTFCVVVLLALLTAMIIVVAMRRTRTDTNPLAYANITAPYSKPYIVENFITENHCRQIIKYATPRLKASEILSGNAPLIRNSQQCWISKHNELVHDIFSTISRTFNIPFSNAEDLQVVRYLPNQYYREHHDSCCDANPDCEKFITHGGQRIITVLIYLNRDFTSGATRFPKLNLELKPNPGCAIIFFPLAQNSRLCHPLALHAGLPVKAGVKWISNVWFREAKFR